MKLSGLVFPILVYATLSDSLALIGRMPSQEGIRTMEGRIYKLMSMFKKKTSDVCTAVVYGEHSG